MQSGLTSARAIVATAALRSHIAGAALPPLMTDLGADEIPRRPLGNGGEQVSIIGLGGYHLGMVGSRDLAVRLVPEAVDAGVLFLTTRGNTTITAARTGGSGCKAAAIRSFLMSKVCTHGPGKNVGSNWRSP